MNIILMGPPGAGKGTQSQRIQDQYGFVQISTGDLVRSEIARATPLGLSIREVVESGAFPSDQVILDLLEERLALISAGVILDGVPRTQEQAEAVDAIMARRAQQIDVVIQLAVDGEELAQRIASRFTCAECGAIYNGHSHPPKKSGVCDKCGNTTFTHRADDSVETARARIQLYQDKTAPLLDYYRAQGKLCQVDGMGTIDAVTKAVDAVLQPMAKKGVQTA